MNDPLAAWTELPNLHPAFVHFPIAFVVLALGFELLSLVRPATGWLRNAATAVWVAAGLGAGAAFLTGRRAADSLLLDPSVQAHVNEHADSALWAVWVLGLLAAARLAWALWEARHEHGATGRASGALFAVVGLLAVAVVARTADLGGGLVFRHGVAVAGEHGGEGAATDGSEAGGERAPAGAEATPGDRLRRGEDGSLTWTPAATDEAALGDLLTAAAGSSLDAVSVAEAADEEGLSLLVEGRSLLVLPGRFGDVQVEAVLDLGGFAGTVGVAHHVRGAAEAGLLSFETPAGGVALVTLEGGETRRLGEADHRPAGGPVRLTVSAVGRHLRGLVDGKLVVHGHEPALPDGACGLLVDGTGRLRVLSIEVTPG